MFTHTKWTIGKTYRKVASLSLAGVPGCFEVRLNNDRIKRPLLIVVHDSWIAAGRKRVAPVVVIQYEDDGQKETIMQMDAEWAANIDLMDLADRADSAAERYWRTLEGLAAADAGDVVPSSVMRSWAKSLGTDYPMRLPNRETIKAIEDGDAGVDVYTFSSTNLHQELLDLLGEQDKTSRQKD